MSTNDDLWKSALEAIPGGVNSPVRAFRGVGGTPRFIERGEGCRVRDVDGREYVDYIGSWGPLILGHAPREVVEAIREAALAGTSFGAPTEREVRLANTVKRLVPCAERVRLVSSGTEATMTAVRLARGRTRRDRIVQFAGGYHGHADSFLVSGGSGLSTLGIPRSAGVPKALAELTLVARYNDIESVASLFDERAAEIAAVIVEPVAANMGVVPPAPGFLRRLRELTRESGALLVFDEVVTGFRIALGGAQELYGVTPDLATFGKVLGGGLPLAAVAGKAEILDELAPDGPVYQAGTLSGNPLATAAALAVLGVLELRRPYAALDAATKRIVAGLRERAQKSGVAVVVNQVGSMFSIFFTTGAVADHDAVKNADQEGYRVFFHACLARGVLFAPSAFEAAFVSTAHDEAAIAKTLDAAAQAFDAVRTSRGS